jgi:hypothetical protein
VVVLIVEDVSPESENDGFVGKPGGAAAAVDLVTQRRCEQAHPEVHHPGQGALATPGGIRHDDATGAFAPGWWTGEEEVMGWHDQKWNVSPICGPWMSMSYVNRLAPLPDS